MGSRVPHTHAPHDDKIAVLDLKTVNGDGEFPSRRFDDQGNPSFGEGLACQPGLPPSVKNLTIEYSGWQRSKWTQGDIGFAISIVRGVSMVQSKIQTALKMLTVAGVAAGLKVQHQEWIIG